MALLRDLQAKLASTHAALGDTTTALRLLARAVADLALLQYDTDQPEAALASIDSALRLSREVLAEDDPEFPIRLFLRGRILQLLRRHGEAHATLEEALTVGARLTDEHPLFLVPLMESLAESRREHHDEKGAVVLLRRAIEKDRRELGDEHYETLLLMARLARTYAEFERRPQTRATVERVLALLDKALPPRTHVGQTCCSGSLSH